MMQLWRLYGYNKSIFLSNNKSWKFNLLLLIYINKIQKLQIHFIDLNILFLIEYYISIKEKQNWEHQWLKPQENIEIEYELIG